MMPHIAARDEKRQLFVFTLTLLPPSSLCLSAYLFKDAYWTTPAWGEEVGFSKGGKKTRSTPSRTDGRMDRGIYNLSRKKAGILPRCWRLLLA